MTYIDQVTAYSTYVNGYLVVAQNKKYGALDLYGKTAIPFVYDYLSYISEDLFAACADGKWGYINRDNKVVIPFVYDEAYPFRDGLARVFKQKKYGYIDKNNNIKIPLDYFAAGDFSEGLAPVYISTETSFGFIDKNQNLLVRAQYSMALPFRNGVSIVGKTTDAWGVIDKNANEIIPCNYCSIRIYKEKYFIARLDYASFDFFDLKGNKIENPQEFFDELLSNEKDAEILDFILDGKIAREIKGQIDLKDEKIISDINQDRYLVKCIEGRAAVIDQFGKILVSLSLKEEDAMVTSTIEPSSIDLQKTDSVQDSIEQFEFTYDQIFDEYVKNTEMLNNQLNILLRKRYVLPDGSIDDYSDLLEKQERLNAIDFISESKSLINTQKPNGRLKQRREKIESIIREIDSLLVADDAKIGAYMYEQPEQNFNWNIIFVVVSIIIILLLLISL